MAIRALVIDDTILYRTVIGAILKGIPEIELVGSAANGELGLAKIRQLQPELVTLDVDMPVLDGISTLKKMKEEGLSSTVIMVSAKTQSGSQATIQALELGAFDFITKPEGSSADDSRAELRRQLREVLNKYQQSPLSLRRERGAVVAPQRTPPPSPSSAVGRLRERGIVTSTPAATTAAPLRPKARLSHSRSALIAIGISTGGPNALGQMLPRLPQNLSVPVIVVQHMPPIFTRTLAESLDRKCSLRVKEAEHGEILSRGTIYIAPGGRQLALDSQRQLVVTDDPPENNCKPAVDYLFRSVAREYGASATCVIMTGMGSDGRLGVETVRAAGGWIIAQDRDSSTVYGMPKVVVEAGLADEVASLDEMAAAIVRTVSG
ncbi:MAG: chemotaxis response regulator protein-glutamate methylesterase [Gammaproteobacteria bacterium]|nr:chemotaxis response regulator protein-glutamate methylesterase [Gammaproteobacteria bacterium]